MGLVQSHNAPDRAISLPVMTEVKPGCQAGGSWRSMRRDGIDGASSLPLGLPLYLRAFKSTHGCVGSG